VDEALAEVADRIGKLGHAFRSGQARMILRPTRKRPPDQWARENRVYPLSSGRPGPKDPALTPYMIPFMRAFDDPN
jgi:hypothetical protein